MAIALIAAGALAVLGVLAGEVSDLRLLGAGRRPGGRGCRRRRNEGGCDDEGDSKR
jgi:hypothetical protein